MRATRRQAPPWFLLLVAASLLPCQQSMAQDGVAWRHVAAHPIKRVWAPGGGPVLLEAGPTLEAIDPATGRPQWTLPIDTAFLRVAADSAGRILVMQPHELSSVDVSSGIRHWSVTSTHRSRYHPDPPTGLVFAWANGHLTIRDLHTGSRLWSTADLPATGRVRGVERFGAQDMLVLIAAGDGPGRILVVSERTGEIVGESDRAAGGRLESRFRGPDEQDQPGPAVQAKMSPIRLADSGFVVHYAGTGPTRFSRSGVIRWNAGLPAMDPQPKDMVRPNPAYATAGELFVVDDGAIVALDLETGRMKWRSKPILRDPPTGLGLRAGTLFAVRTRRDRSYLVGFDPLTGNPRWPPITGLSASDRIITSRDTAFVLWGRDLTAIPLGTGGATRIRRLEFSGSGASTSLTPGRSGGAIVAGPEDLLLVGGDGKLGYHVHHDHVRPGFNESLSQVLGDVLMVPRPEVMPWPFTQDWNLIPLALPHEPPATQAAYFLTQSTRADGRRHRILVMVDPETGEELGRAAVDDARHAVLVDPLNLRVFVLENDRTIVMREFSAVGSTPGAVPAR